MLIQTDAGNLLRQASMTVNTYLIEGIKSIDEQFGEGYAEKHPELLCAFIKACAIDFNTSMRVAVTENSAAEIAQAIDKLGEALRSEE